MKLTSVEIKKFKSLDNVKLSALKDINMILDLTIVVNQFSEIY